MTPALVAVLVFLVALLTTLLLTPGVRRLVFARGLLDYPEDRRVHQLATPRGGGLALVAGLSVSLVLGGLFAPAPDFYWLQTLLLIGLLGLLGGGDDLLSLGIGVRLAGQVVIAAVMLYILGGVETISVGSVLLYQPVVLTGLALIGVIWLINLHNFMDGSDGLATMQAAWVGLAFSWIFWRDYQAGAMLMSLGLAGSALGFLVWNRPVARIFLGDIGSVVIGGLVAWLVLNALILDSASIWVSLVVCSVFVVDATATLLLRVRQGERWYTPHRRHAYQILIRSGWSHGRVLLLYTAINLLIVLPVTLWALARPELDYFLAMGVVALLAIGWWQIQSAGNGEH